MKRNVMFSVGDYELASFATTQRGGGGQAYYFPGMKKETTKATLVTPSSTNAPSTLPKGISSPRIPKETGLVHVPGKGKTYVESGGKGFRKAHIKNIGGKAVMVGQSILKAAKANPKTAGALAAAGVAAGAGGGYLTTRKKRQRR